MRKGKLIKAFFANKNIFYSFEVLPKFDKKTFNETLDDETLDNFKLVSITKRYGFQIFFETTNHAEMIAAIDKIRLK